MHRLPPIKLRRNRSGQTVAEFTLVSIVLVLSLLILWQVCRWLQLRQAVRYAAFFAARSASLGGDPRKSGEQALRAALGAGHQTATTYQRGLLQVTHPLPFIGKKESQWRLLLPAWPTDANADSSQKPAW